MVSIDRAGRVVIPKELRDRLSITPDTELEITVRDDAIEIAPVRRQGRRVVEVDGWPVIEAVEGLSITDSDVQRWRDDSQR
jgi:AbrB family looped-hinge helix DNA binding protein